MFPVPDQPDVTVVDMTQQEQIQQQQQQQVVELESPTTMPTSDVVRTEATTNLHTVNSWKAYPSIFQTI